MTGRAALVLAAVLAAGGCGGEDGVPCDEFRFDRATWLADSMRGDEDGLTARQRISDDLIRCRFFQGRTKREVRRLLGPPVRQDSNPRMWLYIVGLERGPIKMRPETLQVRFEADRVTSARHGA